MKQAISISIGSSRRNKTVETEMLGQSVRLERIGTDGDMNKAAALYQELDGQVDAFGVGGAVLGLMIGERWHTLPNVRSLISGIRKTPVVDGTGLKMTLETQAVATVDKLLQQTGQAKSVFITSGVDRYGLAATFAKDGYDLTIGDLIFTLGIPIPIRTLEGLKRMAETLIPVIGHLPFKWLYPTGKEQEVHKPQWQQYFDASTVIAGDCHYITHAMPNSLTGKIIVTNTTTPEDRDLFCRAGVKYLVTTTPLFDGRTFGTNMIEAGLVSALGYRKPVDYADAVEYFAMMRRAVDELALKPQIIEL